MSIKLFHYPQVDQQTNTTSVSMQCNNMALDILQRVYQFIRLLKGKPPKKVANGNISSPTLRVSYGLKKTCVNKQLLYVCS